MALVTIDKYYIVINVLGIQYIDSSGLLMYVFDTQSGRIKEIQGLVYNVTLNFYYVNNQLQSIQNSNDLKRLNINYTENGLIQRIWLLGDEDTIEKTK